MPTITVKPMLSPSVLKTFEGVFLEAWIGYRSREVVGEGEFVWFESRTDLPDGGQSLFIDLHENDLQHLLELAAEANTPICNLVADVIRASEGNDRVFPSWDRLDLAQLLTEINDRLCASRGYPAGPQDFLHSLVSRHQDEIPYLEADMDGTYLLITPDSVESFPEAEERNGRRDKYVAYKGVSAPKTGSDDSFWSWNAVTQAVSSVFNVLGR